MRSCIHTVLALTYKESNRQYRWTLELGRQLIGEKQTNRPADRQIEGRVWLQGATGPSD